MIRGRPSASKQKQLCNRWQLPWVGKTLYSQKLRGEEEILDVTLRWVSLALPAMGLLLTCSRKGKVRATLVVLLLWEINYLSLSNEFVISSRISICQMKNLSARQEQLFTWQHLYSCWVYYNSCQINCIFKIGFVYFLHLMFIGEKKKKVVCRETCVKINKKHEQSCWVWFFATLF